MGVRSRKKSERRRRAAPSVSGGGTGRDLISGLNDDLLVRILDLLPDTRDVVRTHALSRRWRGLWTGVPALRFNSDSWPAVCREAGAAQQYLAFVDDALTLRAKATTTRCYAVEDLEISLDISGHKTGELVPPSFKAAQGWIRYVVQHKVKSLILLLDLPRRYVGRLLDDENMDPDIALDDLATSAELETMHLALCGAKLRLPSSTVAFSKLTDISLEDIVVTGHLLSRLVSPPCCPHLRKLQLTSLEFSTMHELLLEGDTLLELSIDWIDNMQSLQLKTPSLRVLHVENCFDLVGSFTVASAPRLEDLMFKAEKPLHIVDVDRHLSSVGTLKILLYSHGEFNSHEDRNDGSIRLLQCCRLAKCLEVSLEVVKGKQGIGDIIKGRIPPLPHVTSLTLDVPLREPHFFGSGIGSILAQCISIRHLSLHLFYCITKVQKNVLCGNSCQWESHEFSLPHLQEVEFKKLIGTNCEFRFIQSILTRQTEIQKVAISFKPDYWIKDNKDAFNLLPPLDGGSWTTCNNADLFFKWRKHCV